MKTKCIFAVALALLVSQAPAQRPIFEPQIDLRSPAERAEDQRLEMLRLQREANDELRRQTWELETAAFEASRERVRRQNAEAEAREAAQEEQAAREFEQRRRLRIREEPAATPAHLLPTQQELMDAEAAIKEIRANITLKKSVADAMVESVMLKLTKPGTPAKPPLKEENVLSAGGFIRGLRIGGAKEGHPVAKEMITCIDLRFDIKAFLEKTARELQQAKTPVR